MLNKKWILYGIVVLYLLELLYHALVLPTIPRYMELQALFRLGLGVVVTFGGAALASYWIDRRNLQRKRKKLKS